MIKIPKDVEAYMIQATIEIAKEQEFIPESEKEFENWTLNNLPAICERAMSLQWDLLNKVQKPEIMKMISTILAEKVWKALRKRSSHKVCKNCNALLPETVELEDNCVYCAKPWNIRICI